MAATVPTQRTNPRYLEVQIGTAPRGRVWQDLALLYHWIRGHGYQLIPAHAPRIKLSPSGSRTLRYRVKPSGQAIARVWAISLRTEEATAPSRAARASITYPNGESESTLRLPFLETSRGLSITPHLFVEALSAKSGSAQEIAVTIAHADGDADMWIESVSCFGLPRARLAQDSTDLGVDVETLRPGQPIYDDAGDNKSIAALAANIASENPRRHLAQLAFPTVSITSTSFVDLFALPVPILPRKHQRTDTTRAVAWEVYARASNSTTKGSITISTTLAADTQTIAIDGTVAGGTTIAWHAGTQVDAQCEDLSSDDGLPSGWETFQIQIKRSAGTGTIQIEGVSVYEST